jgi:hypothetical protein
MEDLKEFDLCFAKFNDKSRLWPGIVQKVSADKTEVKFLGTGIVRRCDSGNVQKYSENVAKTARKNLRTKLFSAAMTELNEVKYFF